MASLGFTVRRPGCPPRPGVLRSAGIALAMAASVAMFVSCSGGHSSTHTPAAPIVSATVSAVLTPTPTAIPGYGAPITESEVAATLPAMRDDGRWLIPEAAWNGKIIVNAELPQKPDPSGAQGGPSDEQFLAWDPTANTFDLLWTNQSMRQEHVIGLDGDWALLYLCGYNPSIDWEIRLHNLRTGDERKVDAEFPVRQAPYPVGTLYSRIADGRVLWVNIVQDADHYVEQLRLFNIATGALTIVDSAPAPDEGGAFAFLPGGMSGDSIAYLRVAEDRSQTVVVRSLPTGAERVVLPPSGQAWEAISPDARFAVARLAPTPTRTPTLVPPPTPAGPRFAVDLATGRSIRFAEGQSYGWGVTFAGAYVAWQVAGDASDLIGYFSYATGVPRALDRSVPSDGQGLGVLDGWFFWRERAPGYTAQDNDRTKDLLRFVPLP